MAVLLGANPKIVISTLPLLSPVNQRLSIQSLNGVTYLHDAYNSNPIGFKNALELMDSIEGSRRIVLTPGFMELGSIQ